MTTKQKEALEAKKAKKQAEIDALEKELGEEEIVTASVKNPDDITQIVKDMHEVLVPLAKDSGEIKEAQEKIKADLSEHIGKQEEFNEITEATLMEISEAQRAKDADIFDIIIGKEAQKIMSNWGYHDPITRALYKPATVWDAKAGWKRTGESYGVDEQVMLINDMLFLAGMHRAIVTAEKPNEVVLYHEAVTSFDTYKLFEFELNRNSDLRKALATSNTGSGSEFVPTGFSAKLIDDIRLELKVAGLFPEIQMPGKSGSFEVPLRGAKQAAYLIGEPTGNSPTKIPTRTPPTAKVTFSAVTHGLRMLFSYDMDEDSAIAIMPLVRSELIAALAGSHEQSLVDGDSSTTHQDSDVTSNSDVRVGFQGLRNHGGNSAGQASVNLSTFSTTNLRSMRKKMGRFALPGSTDWIAGISSFVTMLGLAEVLTMDKFGPQATVKTGQLANFDGSPVIVSEYIREDLNASGVYDGTTTNLTLLLLVNNRAFATAVKPGGVLVETGKDIETQQNVAVASRRLDFKQVVVPNATGEESVAVGYNIAT